MTSIDLVLPSYQRPQDLARALRSATDQIRPFDRIIVVVRDGDEATRDVVRSFELEPVTVTAPGVLAAMIAGVAASRAEVVAFTDDDAILTATHAQQLASWFSRDPRIGGVGGPDRIVDGTTPRPFQPTDRVGELSYWGRLRGNHHRGASTIDDVVVLKGVNAAYRRASLRLPRGLRGEGAQPHFEVAIGTSLRARGFRLVYDAALAVEHYPAPRRDDDQRDAPSTDALWNSAYNVERSIPRSHMTRRLLYVSAIGDANVPGLGRLLVATLRGEWSLWRRAWPSWRGTYAAWRERDIELDCVDFST